MNLFRASKPEPTLEEATSIPISYYRATLRGEFSTTAVASSTKKMAAVENDLIQYFGEQMQALGISVEVSSVVLKPTDATEAYQRNLHV